MSMQAVSSEGPVFEKAAVVGLGQLGSSLASALRSSGAAGRVVGYDSSRRARAAAREAGSCDAVLTSMAALGRVDIVALAVPVSATKKVFGEIGPKMRSGTLATDLGSVKEPVARLADLLPEPELFVPGHPVAGNQHAGPSGARADMFKGRKVVLAPTSKTDPDATARVEEMWRRIGARPERSADRISPEEHDRAFALVSHLPHAAAYALASAIDERAPSARDKALLQRLAGRGLLDTTRIAASDPALWAGIMLDNRKELLPAVKALTAAMGDIEKALEAKDYKKLEGLLRRGRRTRNALQKKKR